MAFSKKLTNIAVSYASGQVGLSLTYDNGPADHLLLPIAVAEKLRDRIVEACDRATMYRPTGDRVAVSDAVGMSILPPKEH